MHAVQNERLPLRVVVQVLFFEQVRASSAASARSGNAADLSSAVHSLLPRENGNSYGSSRSAATTTTEEEGSGVPTSSDINSFRSMRLATNGGAGSERSSASSEINNKNGEDRQSTNSGKAKSMLMPKKMLSKLWSGKTNTTGENSGSDTSESPGSANPEEAKSTPSRNTRRSMS